jgi:hypothetical protein
MTPKGKAKELYNLFYNTSVHGNSVKVRSEIAKEHSIKCINQIIESLEYGGLWIYSEDDTISDKYFWQEVKSEIETL